MQPTHLAAAELASAIGRSLDDLSTRLGRGRTDREWTKQLKEDIGDLGVTRGWKVCASGFPGRFECEWLFDLVWYRNDPEGHLSEIYLALESEWSTNIGAIKVDFEKLLVAKATLKVMIFQTNGRKMTELLSAFERGIEAFQKQSADETYILAAFNTSTFKFHVHEIHGA